MPFSQTSEVHTKEYWDNHYDNFLKPLINSCPQVKAHRSTAMREDILRTIINDLAFSTIVVADLTDANPNVYWELGIRLSFKHGTITIAEENSKIPFDLQTKGFLFYPSDYYKRDNFFKKFKEAVNDCMSNPNRPDSIVLETITGRGSIYSVIHHQETLNRLEGLLAENKVNGEVIQEAAKMALKNSNRTLAFLRVNYELIITQLSTSALNLLLSEHYIEDEPEFYETAHRLLLLVGSINERLSAWMSKSENGKWFAETDIQLVFNAFQRKLEEIRSKVLASC